MQEKKEKKSLYEILNYYSDWLIRIIIVNVLVILTSLPIITLIPSITAGYSILSDALNKEEVPIFRGFFNNFKENFTKKMTLSFILVMILLLSLYNNRLYAKYIEENYKIVYTFGYYITLIIVIGTIMISLIMPIVLIEQPSLDLGTTTKLSFYISGKFVVRTFLSALTILIPYLLFLTPFTQLLFVLCGMSITLLLIALITNKVRLFTRDVEVKEDETGN